MIFKQKIGAGEVRQINQAGKHIKIINAQSELQMRVFNAGGSLVLDSAVRSGFELTIKPFAYLTIQSKIDQPFEIWASFDALGYDAPSANANNLSSYLSPHYGDTDPILPFEPNRLSAKIVSNEPWFYGGDNVTKENGIPVAAGEVAEIRGAAKISAAITAKGEYLPQNDFVTVGAGDSPKAAFYMQNGVYYVSSDDKLMRFDGVDLVQVAPNVGSGLDVGTACRVNNYTVAYYYNGANYFCELNTVTGEEKRFSFSAGSKESGHVYRINRISHDGVKYIMVTNGRDEPLGYVDRFCAITSYEDGVFTHKFRQKNSNFTWRQIWCYDVDKFVLDVNYSFALMDFKDLPEDKENSFESEHRIVSGVGALIDYAQCTVYDGKMLVQGQGTTGKSAVLIDLFNGVGVALGVADASAISEVGVLLFRGDEILFSGDSGLSWVSQPNPLKMYSGRDFIYYSTGRYLAVSSRGNGYFITEKRRVNVKQQFRVLKAYS